MALSSLFHPVRFDRMPGWSEDRPSAAFDAFRRSAVHAEIKPYRAGSVGVAPQAFAGAYEEARSLERLADAAARDFFERWFVPCRIQPDDRPTGFVTGFYEPEVEARREPSAQFSVPLLARPSDLIDVDDNNRPAGLDPYLVFGRKAGGRIVEYFDRAEIEQGALGDNSRALAWLESKVDAFFIHVQGAARLKLPDGLARVTYAAKSGQRFTGAGRVLADLGEIPLAEVTMQTIRAWLAKNPHRVDEILQQNRSYIFFREAAVEDPALGPIAAAKVPLTPGRSLAVDRLLHTFGTPFYIDAPDLTAFEGRPFRRLMIAQDTGSAITGPARGDLFAGSGDAAGEIAGVVRADADFYALVPRALVDARP